MLNFQNQYVLYLTSGLNYSCLYLIIHGGGAMNIKKKLGSKIKEIRKSKKYTQEFVAEKMGIETKSLSNIERGLFYPTAENLEKISKILEVQPCELFDFEHHKSDEELKEDILKIVAENPDKLKQIYKSLQAILYNN